MNLRQRPGSLEARDGRTEDIKAARAHLPDASYFSHSEPHLQEAEAASTLGFFRVP